MIKIFVMDTCPDCTFVKEQVYGNNKYEVIDIGKHVRNLKEFCGCATKVRFSMS